MPFAVTDPTTGAVVRTYETHDAAELERRTTLAASAYAGWRSTPLTERARLLLRVADLYDERADELGRIATLEMGKPITQARGEARFAGTILRHYAEHGERYMKEADPLHSSSVPARVTKEPIGVLLGIMPWNYPHYQVARFIAPNLMLGNAVLVKHAPQCPESALAIETLFSDAGAPEGLLQALFADPEQIVDVIAHPVVRGVSLTGSERAGSAVASIAGHHMKKSVLELGGSDAFIVLDDADVAAAAHDAIGARYANTGQACNSAKRFIVHTAVHDEFLSSFTAAVASLRLGDPADDDTFLGPMASEAAAATLNAQVSDAVAQGAVLHGGGRVDRPGAWYRPGVLTGVRPGMRAWHEELFGPVAVVHEVPDDAAAVDLANDSPYGLGAIVRCGDSTRAAALAARLEVGMVSINGTQPVDAGLPFGGVKRSGYGRELGRWAMDEFANHKVVIGA